MIGVHGLCDDLHQRDAVLGFADYHVDVDVDEKLLPIGFVVLIKLLSGVSGQLETVKNDFIGLWSPYLLSTKYW